MIAFALVFKSKALTGKEARFLRKHLCYTGEDLAGIMGVKRMAVTRWEGGKTKITGSNDKHIRRIYLEKKTDEIIKTPGIMRIVKTMVGFLSLDNSPPSKEIKIRREDWTACASLNRIRHQWQAQNHLWI